MLVQVLNPGKKKGRKAKKYAKRKKSRTSKRRVTRRRGSTAQSRACGALATMRFAGVVPPKSLIKKFAGRPRRAKKVSRKSIARRNLVRRSLSGLVCGPGWETRVSNLRKQCGSAIGLVSKGTGPLGGQVFGMGTREVGLNPGLTSGLKPSVLMNAVPVAAGMILNYKVTPMIASRIGAYAQSRAGNIGVGLATAGLSLLVPRFGPKLFAGGVVRVILGDIIPWIKDVIMPPAPAAPATNPQMKGTPWVPEFGLDGLQDLPVVDNVENEEEAVP